MNRAAKQQKLSALESEFEFAQQKLRLLQNIKGQWQSNQLRSPSGLLTSSERLNDQAKFYQRELSYLNPFTDKTKRALWDAARSTDEIKADVAAIGAPSVDLSQCDVDKAVLPEGNYAAYQELFLTEPIYNKELCDLRWGFDRFSLRHFQSHSFGLPSAYEWLEVDISSTGLFEPSSGFSIKEVQNTKYVDQIPVDGRHFKLRLHLSTQMLAILAKLLAPIARTKSYLPEEERFRPGSVSFWLCFPLKHAYLPRDLALGVSEPFIQQEREDLTQITIAEAVMTKSKCAVPERLHILRESW